MAREEQEARDINQYQLWFGVAGGPAAATAFLAVGYLLVTIDCVTGLPSIRTWLLVLAGAMLGVDVVAGLLSYRLWQQLGTDLDPTSPGTTGRRGLMAVAGIAFSLVFGFAIILGAVSSAVLDPCG